MWPHGYLYMALRQRGWSGRTRDLSHVLGFLVNFIVGIAHAEPSLVGRFWRSLRLLTCLRARRCPLGRIDIAPHLMVKSSKKQLRERTGIFKPYSQNIKASVAIVSHCMSSIAMVLINYFTLLSFYNTILSLVCDATPTTCRGVCLQLDRCDGGNRSMELQRGRDINYWLCCGVDYAASSPM